MKRIFYLFIYLFDSTEVDFFFFSPSLLSVFYSSTVAPETGATHFKISSTLAIVEQVFQTEASSC